MTFSSKSPKNPCLKFLDDWLSLLFLIALGLVGIFLSGAWIHLLFWLITIGDWNELGLKPSQDSTAHTISVSEQTIQFYFTNYSGDASPVDIYVMINGHPQAVLKSSFNYDLWMYESPVEYRQRDVDNDRITDLVIQLNRDAGDRYYISGKTGQLYPFEFQGDL